MRSIQSFQTVTGPTLSIAIPAEFEGRQVEILVTPVEKGDNAPNVFKERLRSLTLKKPELSPEWRTKLIETPTLLKPIGYDNPFEPACPPEDWEVNT